MQDSPAALGADLFNDARKAYRLLQLDENPAGLDGLKAQLGRRFKRGKTRKGDGADEGA